MFLIVIHVYAVVIGIQALSELMHRLNNYLCNFMSRNNVLKSWHHVVSHSENVFVNFVFCHKYIIYNCTKKCTRNILM